MITKHFRRLRAVAGLLMRWGWLGCSETADGGSGDG
jgi:hypothetical protein